MCRGGVRSPDKTDPAALELTTGFGILLEEAAMEAARGGSRSQLTGARTASAALRFTALENTQPEKFTARTRDRQGVAR